MFPSKEEWMIPSKMSCLLLALSLLGLMACSGCTSSDVVPVEGKVLYEGEPVSGIAVTFDPVPHGGNRPSQATTKEDGSFKLFYTFDEMGVEPGTHDVTFAWVPDAEGAKATEAIQAIIEAHGEDSGEPLQIEVTEPTKDLVIELPEE
jgi:hypothetical protein